MTGRIIFNDDGLRTEFYLEILELSQEGFKKIATWDPVIGVNYTRSPGEVYTEISRSLQNKTIVVAARVGMPYLKFKYARAPHIYRIEFEQYKIINHSFDIVYREPEEGEYLEGNNRYEGYSIDLIDSIAKILNFQYRFDLVPDNKYGGYNKVTKKWDGLVKHLLDRVSTRIMRI